MKKKERKKKSAGRSSLLKYLRALSVHFYEPIRLTRDYTYHHKTDFGKLDCWEGSTESTGRSAPNAKMQKGAKNISRLSSIKFRQIQVLLQIKKHLSSILDHITHGSELRTQIRRMQSGKRRVPNSPFWRSYRSKLKFYV